MKVNFWQSNNCYVILGITPKASPREIKTAYREASSRCHPDREGGSDEAMMRVNLAYEVLSDAVERVAHDLRWRIDTKSYKGTSGDNAPRTASAWVRETPPQAGRPAPRQGRRSQTDPLSALKRRVQQRVEAETKTVWQNLPNRADHLAGEFRQRMRAARRGLSYGIVGVIACALGATIIPLLWLGAVLSGFVLVGKLRG